MKKEYTKNLKKLFREKLSARFPAAKLWREKSEYIFPGEVVYRIDEYGFNKAFIVLIPDPKKDAFTVEIAWSKEGRFPELSGRPNHLSIQPEQAREYSIRLPYLVNKTDEYWEIPKKVFLDMLEEIMENMKKPTDEEAIALLEPLVSDCVEKIISLGIMHLDKYLVTSQ